MNSKVILAKFQIDFFFFEQKKSVLLIKQISFNELLKILRKIHMDITVRQETISRDIIRNPI